MIAPDADTLFNFDEAIETAVKSLLISNGIAAKRQRDEDVLPVPRVEIQLSVGSATGHMKVASNGNEYPDVWNGSMRCQVVTNRANSGEQHAGIRAKVRRLLYDWRRTLREDLLPYHSLGLVLESGTANEIKADENHDVSSIMFNIVFGIRPDAWPNF